MFHETLQKQNHLGYIPMLIAMHLFCLKFEYFPWVWGANETPNAK